MNALEPADGGPSPAAQAAVAELLADRESAYLGEYRALVDAAYTVAARTGAVEPKVADIVAEAGLSNQVFYRHFASKDELMLAVLEDGRHRLVGYLEHRASRTADPLGAIEQWIRGVLAQAGDADASARTRPFAVNGDRLAARFPDAQSESIDRIRELLASPIEAAVAEGKLPREAESRVELVFWTAFDALKRWLVAGAEPTTADIDEVVAFCMGGLRVGATSTGS